MPDLKHYALTAARVRTLTKPGAYTDGNGLTLRVDARGGKRWIQRVSIDGKQRNIGLGGWPRVGLAEAREAALANLQSIRRGQDPIALKQRAREEAQRPVAPAFRQAAERVIELRRPTWSSDRHANQWTESLTNHAYPVIGHKSVDEVTPADTLAVLTPIWTKKAETATRVKQRMEVIFDWCIVQGWRSDNPASAIARALPRRPRLKQHHPALPYAELPVAIPLIRGSSAHAATKLAFEFIVLTAARTGEVRGMKWDEVDLDWAIWTVPQERMKARREHRVPLTGRAIEILIEAQALGKGGYVFPSKRDAGKPLSNMVFQMLLRRLEIEGTPHGMRSAFKDWSIETGQDWATSEAALAHKLGNSLESAYARTDLFEKRRDLMDQWAYFLEQRV